MPSPQTDTNAKLRALEADVLQRLIDAGGSSDELDPTEVDDIYVPSIRKRPAFTFQVQGVGQDVYDACQRKNQRRAANPDLGGLIVPEGMDDDGLWCDLILEATTPEYRKAIWNNEALLKAYTCVTSKQLVRALIPKAGWRQGIVRKIDALSGFGQPLPSPAQQEATLTEALKG